MKNAQTSADKWSRNLQGAGQSIKDGVMGVTENPAQAAIAQLPVAAQNYQAAIASGKTAAGLSRVTTQSWQQATITKGIPRIAQGAAQAAPKVAAFLAQLIPAVQAAKASLPPRGTKEQNIQRMIQFSQAMSNFKRS